MTWMMVWHHIVSWLSGAETHRLLDHTGRPIPVTAWRCNCSEVLSRIAIALVCLKCGCELTANLKGANPCKMQIL